MSDLVIEPAIDIRMLARRVGELPPLPDALAEALRALGDDDVPAARVVCLIERDPALAARTLRLANSSFYGVPGRVGSIADAVRLLGLRTVSSVLAAASLRAALGRPACEGFSFEAYWHHVLATALAARRLAEHGGLDPDEAFIAGLLHDVGRLVLVLHHPQEMARVFELARSEGVAVAAVERRVLGIAHPVIGAMVTRHWHLPPGLSDAISHYMQPPLVAEGGRCSLAGVVHLANAMAHALAVPPPRAAALEAVDSRLWQSLALPVPQALDLLEATEAALQAMMAG